VNSLDTMPRSALRLLFVVVLIATALAEKGSKGKKSKKRNKGSVPAVDLSASFARQQETAFQGQGYGTKGSPWVAPIVKDSDLPAGHKNYGVNSRKPSAAVLSSPGYLEAATAINAGVEQYQRGRYDEAKKHFLRGIELSKDKHLGSMAHVNIGMVCNAQLQYQEAVKHFEAAVHLVPEDFQAKLELGNALLHSGRFAEAHTVAKEMLPIVNSMGKSKQSALTLIGNVQLANADWAGAAATFERITREFPNFAHGHIGLGEALEHMGMGPQSVAAFRRVLRVAPNDEFAVLALGRTLLRFADVLGGDSLKHLEESVKHMKRYGKLAKPNWATTFNIGVANHRLQHWEEALHYYRETQWRWAMEHNSIPVTVNLLPDENGKPSISPRDAATLAKEQSPNASERDEIVQVP
jgi:tetratricopeptide (TPR) repeat protein